MNISLNIGLTSFFKFIVKKKDGRKVSETPWIKNLVLDNGLEKCAKGEYIQRLYIGTGNSTPIPTQTQLDSIAAYTTSRISISQAGRNIDVPPYYSYSRTQWRFNTGAAVGNMSEIGLGYDDGTLYNRALIKDINGNPTTITILNDEYLDVVVECREYMMNSKSGSSPIKDKNGNTTSNINVEYAPLNRTGGGFDEVPRLTIESLSLSTKDKPSSINGYPNTDLGTVYSPVLTNHPTIPFTKRAVYKIGLTTSVGSIKSMCVDFYCLGFSGSNSLANSGCALQISPVFVKTNLMEISLTFDITLSRYTT